MLLNHYYVRFENTVKEISDEKFYSLIWMEMKRGQESPERSGGGGSSMPLQLQVQTLLKLGGSGQTS